MAECEPPPPHQPRKQHAPDTCGPRAGPQPFPGTGEGRSVPRRWTHGGQSWAPSQQGGTARGCRSGWGAPSIQCACPQRVTRELDQCYSATGSLFRCGFRQTFFSTQLMRYADLYTATYLNFLHCPLSSLYRAAPELVGPCRASPATWPYAAEGPSAL